MNYTERIEPINTRLKSSKKVLVIALSCVVTLIWFLIIDPNPNILLATCSSINVGIYLWAFIWLFEADLLLSPLAFGVVGILQIVFYSWGNLGARIQGNNRFLLTIGAIEYYPYAALLSTVGLLIFIFLSYYLFKNYKPPVIMTLRDYSWKQWQGWISIVFSILIVFFLQYEYEGFVAELHRLLSYSYHYIFSLAIVINTSLLIRTKNIISKFIFVVSIILLLFLVLLDRSRTLIIIFTILVLLSWITIDKNRIKVVFSVFIIVLGIFYFFGTFLKFGADLRGPQGFAQNSRILYDFDYDKVVFFNQVSFNIDIGYRMAGFELPATILMNYQHGTPPMLGKTFVSAFFQGLPSYFRPPGIYSTRKAIYDHFSYHGILADDEEMGIPLASGLADFGIIGGVLIYIIMAISYWGFWRLSQLTPRLFLSFIMIAPLLFYIDLFWDSFFVSFRALLFSWFFLFALHGLFMPSMKKHNK